MSFTTTGKTEKLLAESRWVLSVLMLMLYKNDRPMVRMRCSVTLQQEHGDICLQYEYAVHFNQRNNPHINI